MYAEQELKVCTKCNTAKEKKEFSARNTRPCKLASHCKDCCNKWRREYKQKMPHIYKEYEHQRGLKRNYQLSKKDYDNMLQSQKGNCACCDRPATTFKRRLHVDHDHKTGQVRGLLCTQCNPGLGYFEDSTKRLEMAIKYLNKFLKVE